MFLTVKDLKKSYGSTSNKVEVLKGINFEVEKGEICVLLGPSGSGKSTLLNIIGGIDDADLGYVSIDSEKTKDMKEKELTRYRRKHLGYVFQMYNLIPNLNVKENIEVGAYLSDSPLDINELLNTLGLYEHRHKLPNQLSGGQQQRTAIGRAIVKNPDILLCDEPTGALDYHTSKEILKLIEDVNKKYGNTVIMVTHNDMIFSVICEEWGLLGAGIIAALFIFLIWRCLITANSAPDIPGALLTMGVTAHLGLQMLINIAVVTNSIPNTGIPLPFISYGGTSLIFLMCEIGIVQNIAQQGKTYIS